MRHYGRQASSVGKQTRGLAPWVLWVGLAVGTSIAAPVGAQGIPDVVRPRSDSPTLPPGAGNDRQLAQPRSESPSPRVETPPPVPDRGIITPPVSGLGSTTVIRPPATDAMPIIRP